MFLGKHNKFCDINIYVLCSIWCPKYVCYYIRRKLKKKKSKCKLKNISWNYLEHL